MGVTNQGTQIKLNPVFIPDGITYQEAPGFATAGHPQWSTVIEVKRDDVNKSTREATFDAILDTAVDGLDAKAKAIVEDIVDTGKDIDMFTELIAIDSNIPLNQALSNDFYTNKDVVFRCTVRIWAKKTA